MATATKAVNYTDEQTAKAKADYLANPTKETVEALAKAFGKTTRSIVAKLSREGVYKKAERVTKAGEPIVQKDALVKHICEFAGINEDVADSLEKVNKQVLVNVIAAFKSRDAEIDRLTKELNCEGSDE